MYSQDDLERAWKMWNRKGCPKAASIWGVMYDNVMYNVNFKKFEQTSHARKDDGTLKPPKKKNAQSGALWSCMSGMRVGPTSEVLPRYPPDFAHTRGAAREAAQCVHVALSGRG